MDCILILCICIGIILQELLATLSVTNKDFMKCIKFIIPAVYKPPFILLHYCSYSLYLGGGNSLQDLQWGPLSTLSSHIPLFPAIAPCRNSGID